MHTCQYMHIHYCTLYPVHSTCNHRPTLHELTSTPHICCTHNTQSCSYTQTCMYIHTEIELTYVYVHIHPHTHTYLGYINYTPTYTPTHPHIHMRSPTNMRVRTKIETKTEPHPFPCRLQARPIACTEGRQRRPPPLWQGHHLGRGHAGARHRMVAQQDQARENTPGEGYVAYGLLVVRMYVTGGAEY